MKTILAFGDSLTFGAPPDDTLRHARNDRWPMSLQIGLGHDYEVILEGLNGRTTVYGDPKASYLRAGSDALPTLLHSHQPLDLVILMLGLNDILVAERSARAATRGMARLVEIIRTHPYLAPSWTPQILIVAPPPPIEDTDGEITARDITEACNLAPRYKALAATQGTAFFDAGSVTTGALPDGVHLSAQGSSALGTALVDVVRACLTGPQDGADPTDTRTGRHA